MKSLLIILAALIISGTVAVFGVIALALFTMQTVGKQPTPTTYETGLYVESENIQPASNGRELQ